MMNSSAIFNNQASCYGYDRRKSRPSVGSIRSFQHYSSRASHRDSVATTATIMESKNASDALLMEKKSVIARIFGYDFRYRKSLYATLFAVFFISSILVLLMYFRCYDSYLISEKQKGSLQKTYRACQRCPSNNSYCSNEHGIFECQCEPGYFIHQQECKDVSISILLSQNTTKEELKFKIKRHRLVSELSFCFWIRPTMINSGLTNIVHMKGLSAFINASRLRITWSEKNYNIPVDLAAFLSSHVCVTLSKKVIIYINGNTFWSSGFASVPLNFELTDTDFVNFGSKKVRDSRKFNGEISHFYLIAKKLGDHEIFDILSLNLGPFQHDDIILNWLEVINYANKYLLPMKKTRL